MPSVIMSVVEFLDHIKNTEGRIQDVRVEKNKDSTISIWVELKPVIQNVLITIKEEN